MPVISNSGRPAPTRPTRKRRPAALTNTGFHSTSLAIVPRRGGATQWIGREGHLVGSDASETVAELHCSRTYSPGAAPTSLCRRLPSRTGAGRIPPERSASHSSQSAHQVPWLVLASSSHCDGSGGVLFAGSPIAGALVTGWVDDGRDMPARGQHEARAATEQLRRAVAVLPSADVVRRARDDVAVDRDPAEVDGRAQHRDCPWSAHRVVRRDLEEVPVQGRGMRVVSAFQYRRSNAGGSFPSSQLLTTYGQMRSFGRSHRKTLAISRPSRYPFLAEAATATFLDCSVENAVRTLLCSLSMTHTPRVRLATCSSRSTAARCEAPRRHHTARAVAEDVSAIGARDVQHCLERLDHRGGVRVQAPVTMLRARVAPGDREDLLATPDQVLDVTAPRREVQDVELVDHRRYEEDRGPPAPRR